MVKTNLGNSRLEREPASTGPVDHPSVLVPLLPLPGPKAFIASLLDRGVGTGGRRRARLGRGPRRPTGRWRGCGPSGAPWPRRDATGRPATRRCCTRPRPTWPNGAGLRPCGPGRAKPRAHGVAARPAGPRARGRRRSARRGCGRARLGRRRGRARLPAARGALAARSLCARGALDPDRAPGAVRPGGLPVVTGTGPRRRGQLKGDGSVRPAVRGGREAAYQSQARACRQTGETSARSPIPWRCPARWRWPDARARHDPKCTPITGQAHRAGARESRVPSASPP
jgi:hypothetical protein